MSTPHAEQTPTGDAENARDDTTSIDPRSDPPQADENGTPIDDGMGPDAPADIAGEDEPVPVVDDDDPLAEANEK